MLGLFESKKYQKAIQIIYKAIQLEPNNSHAYKHKLNLLFELDDYQEAIQASIMVNVML